MKHSAKSNQNWQNRLKMVALAIIGLQLAFVVLYAIFFRSNPEIIRTQQAEEETARDDLISKFDDSTPRIEGFSPQTAALAYPPIDGRQTVFVAAESAAGQIAGDDLILGVSFNGQARAYPITQLCGPQREIINDEVGGQTLAATW